MGIKGVKRRTITTSPPDVNTTKISSISLADEGRLDRHKKSASTARGRMGELLGVSPRKGRTTLKSCRTYSLGMGGHLQGGGIASLIVTV